MSLLLVKAPLLLLRRFPIIFAALMAAAAILAAAVAAAPAFLVSAERASLSSEIDQASNWLAGYGVQIRTGLLSKKAERGTTAKLSFVDGLSAVLAQRVQEIEGVGKPYVSIVSEELLASSGPAATTVRLLRRTDALRHVTPVGEAEGSGVWIADTTASHLELAAGDRMTLSSDEGPITTRVAGIYRYLPRDPKRDYWSGLSDFIYPQTSAFTAPPAFVIADHRVHARLVAALHHFGFVRIHVPLLSDEISIEEADTLAGAFQDVTREMRTYSGPFAALLTPVVQRWQPEISATSPLSGIARSARERVETLAPVVSLVAYAGRLVTLTLVVAAGFFLVGRRRIEVTSLVARGIGPVQQGSRHALESVVPICVAALLGTVLGYVAVRLLGPSPDLPASTIASRWSEILLWMLVGVLLLGASSAMAVRRQENDLAGRSVALHPSSVLLIAALIAIAGAVAGYLLRSRVSVSSASSLRDPLVVVVPVILLMAAGLLAAAMLAFVMPRIAALTKWRYAGLFLAARRLVGGAVLVRLLIVSSAWAFGIALYSWTMSGSIEKSAEAKAKVAIGSDVSASVPHNFRMPALPFPATHVKVVDQALSASGQRVALLGIDPDTFADAAYWDDDFAERSLSALIDVIDGPSARPSVIVAGEVVDGAEALSSAGELVPLNVVARTQAFPGMSAERPLIVMDQEVLTSVLAQLGASATFPRDELWATGDVNVISRSLQERGITVFDIQDADSMLQFPSIQSLLWTLATLGALGAVAAGAAGFGLLLYLQARRRAALITGAFSRRMGISRGAEFASWACEMGGALAIALISAVFVMIPVSDLMKGRLDPRPTLAPGLVLETPVAGIVSLAIAIALIATFASWRLQRSLDKANVGRALRG